MANKIRTTILSVLTAFVLLAGSVSVALAAPPLSVHIEVDEFVRTSGEGFFASGPAVDAGVVCQTGTVDDLTISASGSPNNTFVILNVMKRFTCDDSSGTFDARLIVHLDLITNETTARWNIAGGSGDYVDLHGTGSLVGTPIVPGESIHDVYDGRLH